MARIRMLFTDIRIMTLRVLIVDDHAIVRQGVRQLLSDSGSIAVIGEADCGAEALEMTASCSTFRYPTQTVLRFSRPCGANIRAYPS